MRSLDTADELDGDPEQVLRRRLVEPRPAHEPRKDELGGLVHCAAACRGHEADEPLGEREEVPQPVVHAAVLGVAGRPGFDGDPTRGARSRRGRAAEHRPPSGSGTVDVDAARDRGDARFDPPARTARGSPRHRRAPSPTARLGASSASRRSTAIPPNHASIEPPRKPRARLRSSTPSKIAASATSSLVSSPRDGIARFASIGRGDESGDRPGRSESDCSEQAHRASSVAGG